MCGVASYRPQYCSKNSSNFWCAQADVPAAEEEKAGFFDKIKSHVARCDPRKDVPVKRPLDALLLDIGINDVEFYKWVLGLTLDGFYKSATKGYVPCVEDEFALR
jgi:hypothetical protein